MVRLCLAKYVVVPTPIWKKKSFCLEVIIIHALLVTLFERLFHLQSTYYHRRLYSFQFFTSRDDDKGHHFPLFFTYILLRT